MIKLKIVALTGILILTAVSITGCKGIKKETGSSSVVESVEEKATETASKEEPDCKDKDLLALVQHMSGDDRLEKILENQSLIKTPVVRNGKQSTVGYQPEVWKKWE